MTSAALNDVHTLEETVETVAPSNSFVTGATPFRLGRTVEPSTGLEEAGMLFRSWAEAHSSGHAQAPTARLPLSSERAAICEEVLKLSLLTASSLASPCTPSPSPGRKLVCLPLPIRGAPRAAC